MEAFHKQPTIPGLVEGQLEGLEMPESIGPYKVESLLNQGGMSLLYLGSLPEKNIPIAIKVLSPKLLTNQEMVRQFLKEAQIIGLTDHPNIVKLYGQGEWAKGLYIGMEFIQGISLRQFITQQSLSLKGTLDIVLQVAYALLHLHTHGVTHRDLKPENIVITETGQVKVIDFGIAQLMYDTEESFIAGQGRLIGTPNYMSPEQKKNPLEVTGATDIYSLGVITYELIIGKLSLGAINLNLLPKGLQYIVGKALQPTLKKRYQDIVDFITDMTKYLRSGAWEKEKKEKSEAKEIWGNLTDQYLTFLPKTTPKLNGIELGIAKPRPAHSFGLFYDFVNFTNGNTLLFITHFPENHFDMIPLISYLKGMLDTHLYPYEHSTAENFSPSQFIGELNTHVFKTKLPPFACSLLYLTPAQDQFLYLSCGFESLWHFIGGQEQPHYLQMTNPLIGEKPNFEFYETSDNWDPGDILIPHSFNLTFSREKECINLDQQVAEIMDPLFQLSAQSQAEMTRQEIIKHSIFDQETCPRILISLQRII